MALRMVSNWRSNFGQASQRAMCSRRAMRSTSGRARSSRAISRALETYEVAFFREVLLGEDGPLRALLGRDDQNVRWISSTSAAPGTARPRQ